MRLMPLPQLDHLHDNLVTGSRNLLLKSMKPYEAYCLHQIFMIASSDNTLCLLLLLYYYTSTLIDAHHAVSVTNSQ